MKQIFRAMFWVLVSLIACAAARSSDDGGRDISVRDIVHVRLSEIQPLKISETSRRDYVAAVKAERPGDIARLARLQDPATLDEIVGTWDQSKGTDFQLRTQLRRCASPWLLPRLAEFLQRDEATGFRPMPNPEMDPDLGFSHATAVVMRHIILGAPEIPEGAKAWCRPYQHDNYPEILTKMRFWWKDNRESLTNGRYEALVGLPTSETSAVPTKSFSINPPDKSTITPPTASSGTKPDLPSKLLAEQDSHAAPANTVWRVSNRWLWGIGAAGLLALVWLVVLRLKK